MNADVMQASGIGERGRQSLRKRRFLMPVDHGPPDHQSIAGKKREQVTEVVEPLMGEVDEEHVGLGKEGVVVGPSAAVAISDNQRCVGVAASGDDVLQILTQVGDGGAVEVPHDGGLYRAVGERQTQVRPDAGVRIVHHKATTKACPVRFDEVHGRLSLPAKACAEVGRARVECVRKSVFFDARDGALVAVPRQDNSEVSNAKLPRDTPVHTDDADVWELIEHGLSDGLLMGLGLGFEFDQQDVTLNFMRGRKEGFELLQHRIVKTFAPMLRAAFQRWAFDRCMPLVP